ncbi:hypothetical protein [Streptomyces sp. NPDC097981]|uniref:hypothetical protein n=1 Tax=Streptomyces sp. NPDC097981 TaxID=3155428 RepID=UPI0033308F92
MDPGDLDADPAAGTPEVQLEVASGNASVQHGVGGELTHDESAPVMGPRTARNPLSTACCADSGRASRAPRRVAESRSARAAVTARV